MKKILFTALAATFLAAGCQKTEIINSSNPTGKQAMFFSTEIGKITKAEGTTAKTEGELKLEEQGFKLSAVYAFDDIYTTETTEFNTHYDELDNVVFSCVTTGDKTEWEISTQESYFWPGTGKDLVFFALSSKQDNVKIPEIKDNGFKLVGTPDEKTGACADVEVADFIIKDYTVTPPTYIKEAGQNVTVGTQTGADDDLMIAEVVIRNQADKSAANNAGEVDLFFNHTLSKVQFKFTTNATTAESHPVTVKSVIVKDVVTKADLKVGVTKFTPAITDAEGDVTQAAVRTSDNTYDWSPAETGQEEYVVDVDHATKAEYKIDYELNLTGVEGGQPYATWLVIPQTLENKMVSVTYTIGDGNATPKEFTSVWPLKATGLDAWTRNQFVTYTINLSPNLITFSPKVENDWTTGSNTSLNN